MILDCPLGCFFLGSFLDSMLAGNERFNSFWGAAAVWDFGCGVGCGVALGSSTGFSGRIFGFSLSNLRGNGLPSMSTRMRASYFLSGGADSYLV